MPRGYRISTQQKNRVLAHFNSLLISSETFDVGSVEGGWLTYIRAFRPKQYQVDYYVNRTTLPNALIQLFLDVSPAMISIVGTERDVYRDTMRELHRTMLVNSGENGMIGRNMAYALASLGEIGYAQNNVPNFRKPSGMPDGNWQILKNKIEDGIRSGEQNFDESIRQGDAFVDMDGEATPEVVEGEVVEIAPPEVIEEDEAIVGVADEPIVEEVEETNYATLPVVEGSEITPSNLRMDFSDMEEGTRTNSWYGKLRVAEALFRGGWDVRSIKKLFRRIEGRGFYPNQIASRRGGYIVIRVESTTDNPRRFQSSTLRDFVYSSISFNPIDFRTAISDFYSTGAGRNLRSVSFSGRGSYMRGILAIPTTQSIVMNSIPTISEIETRYRIAGVLDEISAEGEASPPTSDVPFSTSSSLVYLGHMIAPSGRLYGRSHTLQDGLVIRFSESDRASSVTVWYFAKLPNTLPIQAGAEITFYQLQWGSIGDYEVRSTPELHEYFKNNSRLSRANYLQLFKINDVAVQQALLSQDAQTFEPTWLSNPTPFNLNEWSIVLRTMAFNRVVAEIEAEAEQIRSATISEADLIAVGEAEFNLTFGFELEANNPNMDRSQFARAIRDSGVDSQSEAWRPRGSRGYEAWKVTTDGTVTGANAFELVSPILSGEGGLENLRKVLNIVQESGVNITRSAGVHVHFDNNDWEIEVRKNIILNYMKIEAWVSRTQPEYRRGTRWAKKLSGNINEASVDSATSQRGLTSAFGGDRYYAINLTNTRIPTWEWRYPQSSTETDTNENTVRLIGKIIEVSKVGRLSDEDVTETGMVKWMGRKLFTFWRNRAYDLSQTEGVSERPQYRHLNS
jgi:hypothetical protein